VIPAGPPRPIHLAQLNLARLRSPLDSESVRAFVAALDRINRVAEH